MINHSNRAFSREVIFSSLEELKKYLEEYESKIKSLYPNIVDTGSSYTSLADFDFQKSTIEFLSNLILQGKIKLQEVPQYIRFNRQLYIFSFRVSRDILLSEQKGYSSDDYINTIKLFFDDLQNILVNAHPKDIIYCYSLPDMAYLLQGYVSLDVLWRNYAFKDFIKNDWQEAIQRVYKQLGRGEKKNYEEP